MSDETREVRVYRLVVYVVDHDGVGAAGAMSAIENARYPNRCIHPTVDCEYASKTVDWHDQHPINITTKSLDALRELFEEGP